jgi:hypothetical protein
LACITKGTTEQPNTTLYCSTGCNFSAFTSSTLEITEDLSAASSTVTLTRHFTTAIHSFFVARWLGCISGTRAFAWEHGSLTNLRRNLFFAASTECFSDTARTGFTRGAVFQSTHTTIATFCLGHARAFTTATSFEILCHPCASSCATR